MACGCAGWARLPQGGMYNGMTHHSPYHLAARALQYVTLPKCTTDGVVAVHENLGPWEETGPLRRAFACGLEPDQNPVTRRTVPAQAAMSVHACPVLAPASNPGLYSLTFAGLRPIEAAGVNNRLKGVSAWGLRLMFPAAPEVRLVPLLVCWAERSD